MYERKVSYNGKTIYFVHVIIDLLLPHSKTGYTQCISKVHSSLKLCNAASLRDVTVEINHILKVLSIHVNAHEET